MMTIIHCLKCTVVFSFAVPPLLSLVVIHCHSLLLFSLSLVATLCHSLYHSLSLTVIRCHLLSFVVSRCTTRCHSLSLVVPLVSTPCHSLILVLLLAVTHCHSLSLVVTRCTTHLSFYKRSNEHDTYYYSKSTATVVSNPYLLKYFTFIKAIFSL